MGSRREAALDILVMSYDQTLLVMSEMSDILVSYDQTFVTFW